MNGRVHDDIPGGMVLENYGPHPIRVYSHTERRRIMAERGLRLKEQWAPLPGTGRDPQGIPNPIGFMDPQTIENARALVSRQGEVEPDEEAISFTPFNSAHDRIVTGMTVASINRFEQEGGNRSAKDYVDPGPGRTAGRSGGGASDPNGDAGN